MNEAPQKLHRRIGFFGLLFISTGSIIGSGWLFAALYAAQMAGPASIISWFLAAMMLGVIALVFAELGSTIPTPGGFARYAHISFGGMTSFIASWLCWLGYVVIPSVETLAILEYLGNEIPWLIRTEVDDRSLSMEGTVIAAAILFSMLVINLLGVKWLAHSNTTITWWKIAVPVMTAIVLIFTGFDVENFTSHSFAPEGISGIFSALAAGGVVFSLIGFRTVIELSGEARRPQRDVPMAILGSLLICTSIFILVQIAFIGVVPAEQLTQGWSHVVANGASGPFAAFAMILGLGWLATILYVDATISPFGTALVFTSGTSRLVVAMSRNRNIPKFFGRIARSGLPVRALFANWIVGMILLAPLPGWDLLAGIVSATTMLTAAVASLAMISLRVRHPELNRPFRVPAARITGTISFIFASLITYWCGWKVNETVLIVLAIGFVLMLVSIKGMGSHGRELKSRHALWLAPWLGGLFLISFLGDYAGGLGWLSAPWGEISVVLWCLLIAPLGVRSALDRETSAGILNEVLHESRA